MKPSEIEKDTTRVVSDQWASIRTVMEAVSGGRVSWKSRLNTIAFTYSSNTQSGLTSDSRRSGLVAASSLYIVYAGEMT